MIELIRCGQLGDWLFQFCFAKLLAERFEYALNALPIPGFSTTFRKTEGDELLSPQMLWHGHWPYDAYTGRLIEPRELLCPPGERLTLGGFFQRFEFFVEKKDEICEHWLRFDNPMRLRKSDEFVICLCQDTKLGGHNSPLTESNLTEFEVRRLTQTVSHRKLYIIAESSEHSLCKSLKDLNAEVVVYNPIKTLLFIQSFQKIAISQCALHWWGAFLSNAREIYFPPCDRGIWSHPKRAFQVHAPPHHGIDLRVDESRYIYNW